MPYNCEDCGKLGARLNSKFGIRLCEECVSGPKYKLICKSNVLKDYKLLEADLNNNPGGPGINNPGGPGINNPGGPGINNPNLKEYYGINPYWRSGPPITLYLETEIFQLFLQKHNDIIRDILEIENPEANMELTVSQVLKYIEYNKNKKRQNKYAKLLDKHNIEIGDLPTWVQENLENSSSFAEYSRVLDEYFKFKKLYKILRDQGLKKYINHPISHSYIYSHNKANKTNKINPEQIPILIRFMLNKKKILKKAITDNNLPVEKYSYLYNKFINSFDTSNELTIENDIDTLVFYIKDKEFRKENLLMHLNKFNLELRSDSVLCTRYLEGDDTYSPEHIADIMDQMRWFFSHTDYSKYSREYDRENREYRREIGYYNRYDSESDSDEETDREQYNKIKSEYVKEKCLTEWIKEGKKGVEPPSSLNWLILQIEEKLANRVKKIQVEKTKSGTSQINCANSTCHNNGSKMCVGLRCGLCCNGVGCKIHQLRLNDKL